MRDNLNWKAFRYALAVFMILIFLWWFTTGADIFLLSRKETPAAKMMALVSESFKLGWQTIIQFLGF